MSGDSTAPDHLLIVDCGQVICLRARAKWACKARRLKEMGRSPRLRGFATSLLTMSNVIYDDQIHDVGALIILGGRTDILMDLKRI